MSMGINKLKVGIAGYGVVGKRRRFYIDTHESLETIAVCDQVFDGTGQMEDGLLYFSNYKQLLEQPLDILFVCVPNYLAAEITIAGLERGMHVFCEKPPGCSLKDIENVIEVEKQNSGLILKYGFNHRYHDSVRKVLEIIESGEMGEIINLRGVYGKSKIIPFSGGWRAERKYSGGGILLDQGIHMVDLMQLFCSKFVDVKSYVSNDYWSHDVEDNTYALMKSETGQIAMLHSSATQWQHRFLLEIALTEGYLELRGILTGSKSYGQETLVVGKREDSDNGTQAEQTITYLEDNSWRDEIFEFADAVMNGKRLEHGTSEEALNAMNIVFSIYGADENWKNTYDIPGVSLTS